jgi:hypothetical protein
MTWPFGFAKTPLFRPTLQCICPSNSLWLRNSLVVWRVLHFYELWRVHIQFLIGKNPLTWHDDAATLNANMFVHSFPSGSSTSHLHSTMPWNPPTVLLSMHHRLHHFPAILFQQEMTKWKISNSHLIRLFFTFQQLILDHWIPILRILVILAFHEPILVWKKTRTKSVKRTI